METLNTKITQLTSDEIISLEPLSSGFCSSTQKVIGKKGEYVLRNATIGTPWFEYLSDIRRSFEFSHLMYLNAEEVNHVKSFGVFQREGKFYHLQEFKKGDLLHSLGNLDENLIEIIATKIGEIHKAGRQVTQKKVPISEQKGKYLRSGREVLTHQELSFSIYENYPITPADREILQNLIQLLMQQYFIFVETWKPQRITTLHGDFWNGNMIYDGKEVFFIDFSRLGYGEAWIDIWTFIANLEIAFYTTGEEKYQHFIELFYKIYLSVSEDPDIKQYVELWRIRTVYLHFSPLLQKFLDRDVTTKQRILEGMHILF